LNIKDQDLALLLEDRFLSICPSKANLIKGSIELLEYLNPKYEMHVLTNGFLETQNIKIQTSNIAHYFKTMTTSECSGYKKPNPKIFDFKLERINAKKEECLMIGDNLLTDIGGARRSGIDQLFFNPTRMKHKGKVTYEVSELLGIKKIL
jgi:putative hydrolase of the HAD superfamily